MLKYQRVTILGSLSHLKRITKKQLVQPAAEFHAGTRNPFIWNYLRIMEYHGSSNTAMHRVRLTWTMINIPKWLVESGNWWYTIGFLDCPWVPYFQSHPFQRDEDPELEYVYSYVDVSFFFPCLVLICCSCPLLYSLCVPCHVFTFMCSHLLVCPVLCFLVLWHLSCPD